MGLKIEAEEEVVGGGFDAERWLPHKAPGDADVERDAKEYGFEPLHTDEVIGVVADTEAFGRPCFTLSTRYEAKGGELEVACEDGCLLPDHVTLLRQLEKVRGELVRITTAGTRKTKNGKAYTYNVAVLKTSGGDAKDLPF